ncbi:MAG TPA: hypothetical protein VK034_13040, partial [Enhygromyxa sp.]|nr:hypothetical protein [Enhygromyxa sp.]
MKKRRKATAAGDRRALALSVALASACSPEVEPTIEAEAEVETEAEVDPHAEARERLAAFEHARREAAEFATIPASDGRFGADPYQLIALPDGRVAGLLRGDDRVVLFDRGGAPTGSAATVHDPTDLAWRDGELWVVGTGEARIARYRVSDGLEPNGHIELAEAFAPRAIAVGPDAVFVADERGRLHVLRDDGPVLVVDRHCRGPLALELVDDRLLLANCLLDHRIRIDRLDGDALVELGAITHDGPIWSFASGPELDGERLLALTGVEDRPLDRSDGGFGYVDSFVFVYALGLDGDSLEITRRATINVSELGVVTPKWSRWLAVEQPAIELAGYATAELLRLRFVDGLAAAPIVERSAGLPGTTAVVELADRSLLAANPLLDGWLRLGPETSHPRDGMVLPTDAKRPAVAAGMAEIRFELLPVDDDRDDRSFAERLGEALVFTTAMAPQNSAEGQRSRFTCETCHFEGRGDGRTHFTGRERDGQRIHATSKPLLGL